MCFVDEKNDWNQDVSVLDSALHFVGLSTSHAGVHISKNMLLIVDDWGGTKRVVFVKQEKVVGIHQGFVGEQ